jgi:protein TonB
MRLETAPLPERRLSRWRRRWGRILIGSALAHLALLLLVLLFMRGEGPAPEPEQGQTVSVVFAPPAASPEQSAGLEQAPLPGVLPTPTAPPEPEPQPQPAAPPPPPPPAPETPPQEAQAEAAPASGPVEVHINPMQMAQLGLAPLPPLSAPTPVTPPPVPRPAPVARPPRPRVPQSREFPAVINYSLNGAQSAPRRQAPSMDGSPGAGTATASGMLTEFAKVREGNPGPDFYASLREWWFAHRFYPDEAAMKGEDGDVHVALVVDRSGHVRSVELTSRSGSIWLDMAGVATWRDARLIPVPDSMGRDQITVDLTLHYYLVRQ